MTILFVGDGHAYRRSTDTASRKLTTTSWILLQLLATDQPELALSLWCHLWSIVEGYESLPEACKPLIHWAVAALEAGGISLKTLPLPGDLSEAQLRGKLRHAWAGNALHASRARRWISVLNQAGCPAVAIKGLVAASQGGVARRGRTAHDVDLWVPEPLWLIAQSALQASGCFESWQLDQQHASDGSMKSVHAVEYSGSNGLLDLHRHPLPGFMDQLKSFVWSSSFRRINGLTMPSLPDHLALMTLHAFSFNNLKSDGYLRCLADVLPWLKLLDSTDRCQFDDQLLEHGAHSQVRGQIWRLHAELQNRLKAGGH